MKKLLPLLAVLAMVSCHRPVESTIDNPLTQVSPAFWWAGMQNPELQLMLEGDSIARFDVSVPDAGVRVKEVARTVNPNYLFVYLDIRHAKAGAITLNLTCGEERYAHTYTLRERSKEAGAQGFTKADVLYLIMPDRYANGNTANDTLDGYGVDRTRGGRHGGDFQGIEQHLGYIDSLGVTAIWLNPVQYNKGGQAHGYSVTDYYKVDPRLGSNEEYCQLIRSTHERGMKVVMDMIFNHCGFNHPWLTNMPDSDWVNQQDILPSMQEAMRAFDSLPANAKQEDMMRVYRRLMNRNDGFKNTTHYKWTLLDPHAPQTEKDVLVDGWFSRGMPDLNQRNRHLATYLIQNSIWWIEYSRIDGIRMDTYPYADFDFMARWCREIKAEYPDFNIVGEGWYPRNSAAGWWQTGSRMHEGDTYLPSVMDFDFCFTAQAEMHRPSSAKERYESGLFKMYETVAQDFLIPNPDNVLVFLDNHDITRYMRTGDPLSKFKQGMALLLTTRGIPQIYYGTELVERNDENYRELRPDFPGGWPEDEVDAFTREGRTAEQNEAWDYLSALLQWRRRSEAIRNGHLVHYTPDDRTQAYVYAQTDGEHTVLVMLSGSDEEKEVKMGRFSEVIGGNTQGTDVVTGRLVDLTRPVVLGPREALVMDLK